MTMKKPQDVIKTPGLDCMESKNSEQRSRPCNYDPTFSLNSLDKIFYIKNLPLSRLYNTTRFLLSKIEREGRLSDTEHFVLLQCFDKCDSNLQLSWVLSKKVHLERMKFLIESYHRILKLGVPVIINFSMISKGFKYREFLLTSHAYFGMKNFLNVRKVLKRIDLNKKTYPPSKRFVGVGYKDHGSRRKLELDATHTWQDLSMSESFQSSMKDKRQWIEPHIAILTQWGLYPERRSLVIRD